MDNEATTLKEKHSSKASMSNRFIDYVLTKCTGVGVSVQSAQFDTLTRRSTFASDFFFNQEDLKHW